MTTARIRQQVNTRVAFIAHALLPGYVSTAIIDRRLEELSRSCLREGIPPTEAQYIRWWNTEFVPIGVGGAHPVHLDFDIIPLFAPDVLRLYRGNSEVAYQVAAEVAECEMDGALSGGSPVVIGWGALTKNLTDHGTRFLEREPPLDPNQVSTNHGDAGTTALTLMAMERLQVKPGKTICIMGASGVIGSALARTVGRLFSPHKIVLVGRKQTDLLRISMEIEGSAPVIVVDTNYETAANTHDADVVLVATSGLQYDPENFPYECLILDICTPAACDPGKAWGGRVVLAAGCGILPEAFLPNGLATMNGKRLDDVGAGGKNHTKNTLWGCTCECIAQASFRVREHVVGPITEKQVLRARHWFEQLGIEPQRPVLGVREWNWEDLHTVRHTIPALC